MPIRSDLTDDTLALGTHPAHHNTLAIAVNDLQDTRVPALESGRARQTANITTASLAANAGASGTVTLAKTWRALRVSTNFPARLRLYTTPAKRDADVSRVLGVSPTGDHGCVLDIDTETGLLGFDLAPQAIGSSMAATPATAIAYRIENLDSVARAITATIVWQQEEW